MIRASVGVVEGYLVTVYHKHSTSRINPSVDVLM